MGMGMVGLLPDHTIIPLLAVQDDHNLDSSHHHHHHHRRLPAAVAPIHFWQQQQQQQHQHQQQAASGEIQNYLKKPVADNPAPSPALDRIFNVSSAAQACAGIGIGTSSSSGSTTCQDCGNQAKKDCSHRRCRTCCKSRGFECSTHVKSTWVPAARRRERLHAQTAAAGSSASNSTTKKPRLIPSQTTTTTASHTSTSNTTPPRSFDSGSSHQDASFRESLPGQVRAPAVFKCVRVTAVEDGEDEYAYQAVVKIGGHVFKGFLYDQGVDSRGDQGIPNFSDLHLGGARNVRNAAASTSSPIVDPSDVYAASGPAALLGGATGFGNPIN